MEKKELRNFYNSVKNFVDSMIEVEKRYDLFHNDSETGRKIRMESSELFEKQTSYSKFKEYFKSETKTGILNSIQSVYNDCQLLFTSADLGCLKKDKDVCLRAATGVCENVQIRDKVSRRLDREERFMPVMPLGFAIVIIILTIVGINFLDDKPLYEEDTYWFEIQRVNLVQYSNKDSLTGYVYLKAPNGREITIKDLSFYEQVKQHVHQKVELKIKRSYVLNKEGKKTHVNEEFIEPFEIVAFSGEETAFDEHINNVEVQRRTVVIPAIGF